MPAPWAGPGPLVPRWCILWALEQDASDKLLCATPRLGVDLLRGFMPDAWGREADFTTLERVSSEQMSDDLRDRQTDIIWRLRWRDDWLYVYLLLELQSGTGPDPDQGSTRHRRPAQPPGGDRHPTRRDPTPY